MVREESFLLPEIVRLAESSLLPGNRGVEVDHTGGYREPPYGKG